MRNRTATFFRLVQTSIIALLIGLTYFGVGNERDQNAVIDQRGLLFFSSIQQAMASLLMVIAIFHGWDRVVFQREHASSLYDPGVYYVAKFLTELPFQLLSPIIFCCVTYSMVNFGNWCDEFPTFFVTLLLCTLVGQALGMFISVATPTSEIANIIAPCTVGLAMICGGLFLNVNTVPSWLSWILYSDFAFYAFQILASNFFTGKTFSCPSPVPVNPGQFSGSEPIQNTTIAPTASCLFPTGEAVLKSLSFENVRISHNMIVLVSFWIVFQVLAFLGLKFLVARKLKQ